VQSEGSVSQDFGAETLVSFTPQVSPRRLASVTCSRELAVLFQLTCPVEEVQADASHNLLFVQNFVSAWRFFFVASGVDASVVVLGPQSYPL